MRLNAKNKIPLEYQNVKWEYVKFILEMTDYDLDATANILRVARLIPEEELKKQILAVFN